jgi:hypothetical protein
MGAKAAATPLMTPVCRNVLREEELGPSFRGFFDFKRVCLSEKFRPWICPL